VDKSTVGGKDNLVDGHRPTSSQCLLLMMVFQSSSLSFDSDSQMAVSSSRPKRMTVDPQPVPDQYMNIREYTAV
jgi:hypothetical protein